MLDRGCFIMIVALPPKMVETQPFWLFCAIIEKQIKLLELKQHNLMQHEITTQRNRKRAYKTSGHKHLPRTPYCKHPTHIFLI